MPLAAAGDEGDPILEDSAHGFTPMKTTTASGRNERATSARISPTMPRRKARTHTTNTAPVMTVTHEPTFAR